MQRIAPTLPQLGIGVARSIANGTGGTGAGAGAGSAAVNNVDNLTKALYR